MLWNELLRKGNVSLLQSQCDTQYCVCRNYNPEAKENTQYDSGIYFCYWEYPMLKVEYLSRALEAFRCKTEENYISRYRLEELASKFADGLMQDDKESAMEYFTEECEMEDYEMKFFGIKQESEGKMMEYTVLDEVRVRTHQGRIGTIEKVIYEMVDSKETDNVYCYEMEIDGISGCIVYPDEIDE